MVQRSSQRRQRDLRELGDHIRRWRKINGLTAVQVAERAAVTRETLRNIETGTGSPRLDSFVAVLSALGITSIMLDAINPYTHPSARARMDDIIGSGGEL
ncbi:MULTISPECIES: helix-turn-helix domain-containing protein [Microbacterium]|jgi:transcriptional regulator with XRE-family HTH domain|uniref:Helix-turn-helix domain-containing protein n=1 Tax=Microbacterium schleiferi TaxID=69362 RepID=A0ABU7V9J1_9MICO|nr:helix-turn-helix domain-containing protein [Microbacterium sp.]MBD3751140.1 helix-turn-helix domain-containing protein [Micrococcales bacterium]